MQLEFGNIAQIKQAKEAVRSAEAGVAFDHLHLALCEKENLTKKEGRLFNHMESLVFEDDFGLTDGYSETKP